MRRSDEPYTVTDRVVLVLFTAAAAAIMALDLVTCVRFLAFWRNPPAAHEVEAQVRYQHLGRKSGSVLHVQTRDGWIDLTTGPSTVLGMQRSGVDPKRVYPDIAAKVAWIDAPACVSKWTTHYPVHVEQMGRVLLDIDGAAGITRAELPGVAFEAVLAGAASSVFLWMLLARARQDKFKISIARDAWHERRGR